MNVANNKINKFWGDIKISTKFGGDILLILKF
jgi:hypothetical protein